jgi:hypothetical protein
VINIGAGVQGAWSPLEKLGEEIVLVGMRVAPPRLEALNTMKFTVVIGHAPDVLEMEIKQSPGPPRNRIIPWLWGANW